LNAESYAMKIGLVRHAKVNYRDPFFSSGKLFDESRAIYDATPVETVALKIKAEDFPLCYVSSKPRAIETAKMIYNGNFIITDELVEVKSAAFFFQNVKIPSALRSVAGRIAWFFNYKKMPETRRESNRRARKFISRLLSESNEDTLLVTHGIFMYCLKNELRKQGFKGRVPFFPGNALLFVFEKPGK
jgi:broad specificity phosphatase PhoE